MPKPEPCAPPLRLLAILERRPEAVHVPVPGTPHVSLEVRGKRFAWYVEDHDGDGRIALHCRAQPGVNRALVDEAPERYFVPPYLGARGWAGIWLDVENVDWEEVEALLQDSYGMTAPKSLTRLIPR